MSPFSAPQVVPQTAVIHVGKALDFRTALVFRALCQEHLDQGVSRFILDFSSTGSLDTTGLGAIFAIDRQARLYGGGVALAALTRPVQRVVDATEARSLTCFATVSEAAGSVSGSVGAICYRALFTTFTFNTAQPQPFLPV